MRLVFLHPDLGVGGAERLILDTAIAAKSKGHSVTILTNQYDRKHCFEDSKSLDIIVKYSSLPRQICGRFHALLSYLKLFLAALWLVYLSDLEFDAAIIDQISLPVAVFKWKRIKCLFYCHFPDQLLCVYDKRRNLLKRLYRAPLDWLEATTTGMADMILVNSEFTKRTFRKTFANLATKPIEVLYPSLNTECFDSLLAQFVSKETTTIASAADAELNKLNQIELAKLDANKTKYVFLSINRYERKKDLKLAVHAMSKLRELIDEKSWQACHLVMAGGYDRRVEENVSYYDELYDLATSLDGLNEKISFLRSITDEQKIRLLRRSFCLIYTPTNEHFGIVPIEAMYCEKPVLATSSGGPLETVLDGVTGFLVDADPSLFAVKMQCLINDSSEQHRMSLMARERVIAKFSFLAFKEQLNEILLQLISSDANANKKDE